MGRQLKRTDNRRKVPKDRKVEKLPKELSVEEDAPSQSLSDRLLEAEDATLHQAERCEVQVFPAVNDPSEGCEASNRLADRCKKNPGHTDFIPITDLTTQHLPEAIRNEVSFRYIQHVANLTVKLTVRYTSPDRPAELSNGLQGGSTRTCFGTGIVEHVPTSSVKERRIGNVYEVNTAAHVVYDDAEAAHTTVEFFYDNDDDTAAVKKGMGTKVTSCDAEHDRCVFQCVVHDKHDSVMIRNTLDQREADLICNVNTLNLSCCVSHPHGLSKRVTFGSIVSIKETVYSDIILVHMARLLIDQCAAYGLSDKKIMYAYCYVNMQQQTWVSSDGKVDCLNHLVRGGYLELPLKSDTQRIMNKLTSLIKHIDSEAENLLKTEAGFKSLTLGDKQLKRKEQKNKLIRDKASLLPVDGFDADYGQVHTEVMSYLVSIAHGGTFNPTGVTETVTYSTPTCPGSSGAGMLLMKQHGTGVKHYKGPHSRGEGKNIGACRGGSLACFFNV